MTTWKDTYTKEYEWGGYSIWPSKAGWIVEDHSQVSGQLTGRKVVVAYNPTFPRGMSLDDRFNGWYKNGEALYENGTIIKVLRKGYLVR